MAVCDSESLQASLREEQLLFFFSVLLSEPLLSHRRLIHVWQHKPCLLLYMCICVPVSLVPDVSAYSVLRCRRHDWNLNVALKSVPGWFMYENTLRLNSLNQSGAAVKSSDSHKSRCRARRCMIFAMNQISPMWKEVLIVTNPQRIISTAAALCFLASVIHSFVALGAFTAWFSLSVSSFQQTNSDKPIVHQRSSTRLRQTRF